MIQFELHKALRHRRGRGWVVTLPSRPVILSVAEDLRFPAIQNTLQSQPISTT